ncbi:MAG TPA: copper-containing nitrite reductase [Anaerolineales bacterium]
MKNLKFLVVALLVSILMAACAPQAQPVVDNEYILTTALRDGNFVYLGVNNNIAGLSNPALHAKPGETVSITLVNGGEGEHDIVFPALNVKSTSINKKGETTSVTFRAPDKDTALEYFDSTHEKLGMKGALLVGSAALEAQPPAAAAGAAQAEPVSAAVSAVKETGVTVEYSLSTGLADGKMVFIGQGGDIEGKTNPELKANPGDKVKITLSSGDGSEHDIFVEQFNAKSERVKGTGTNVVLEFVAAQEGTFVYYCTVPGHRQAGMEGKLVVGSGTASMAAMPGMTTASAPAAGAGAAPVAVEMPGPVDAKAVDISRDPTDLPAEIGNRAPQKVRVDLETIEVSGKLADGTTFTYWTFNGKVPGPFLRVRVGDTVEVHLKNSMGSSMMHSVDFHAVTGPGGGAVATQTKAGEETMFTFKALNPGLFVYHCATPMVALHISNGMYGMILVEPEGGLPKVDHEFYVMQGELYTAQPFGTAGNLTVDTQKLLDEKPEYFVFNGASMALASDAHALHAKTGETVRIFFGVGGPNFISSFHVIGEIFDRVYDQASLTSKPLTDVQTTLVPPGGATMVEFQVQVPGRYILVDHALARMQRGLAGYLYVDGDPNPDVFNGVLTPGSGH